MSTQENLGFTTIDTDQEKKLFIFSTKTFSNTSTASNV